MLPFLQKLTGAFHEPPPPPDEFEKSISPELIKKIRDIQVKTNHLVNHMMSGEYVSAFKGRGMEFSEVREYEPVNFFNKESMSGFRGPLSCRIFFSRSRRGSRSRLLPRRSG